MISFKECNITTHLTVHEGKYWKDESFILKKNTLMEFKTNKRIAYARIRKVKHNTESKKDEITIKLFNTNGDARAHLITTNFISSNDLKSFNSIKDVLDNSITTEKFRLSEWKNAYLSNRKLGDEFRYVFDRKYRKRYTGNSLDKPQIILKRLKIRETSFEEEVVKLGDNYASLTQKELLEAHPSMINYDNMFLEHSQMRSNGMRQQMSYMNNTAANPNRFRPKQQTRHYIPQTTTFLTGEQTQCEHYKSYMNFLKYSSIVKANLRPDKNGNISFTVPSGKYTNLYILISDIENVMQIQIDLPSKPTQVQKRDLSLVKPLDPKKNYNEVRNVIKLAQNDKHKIKDITSADYNIIDCLDKVKTIQMEIAKMDGYTICPDLLFLINWHNLTREEKIRKYTNFICHETHLFLYFKDAEFFKEVVRPFIVNKHEKSLIDYWLLGNYEKIEQYTSVEFFDNLNSVEKILLIYIVVQNGDATPLMERIKLNAENVAENLAYRNI